MGFLRSTPPAQRTRRAGPVLLAALLSLLTLGQAMAATTYEIDKTHSSPTFRIRHFFSKVSGRFADFSGTIQYDESTPVNSTVSLTIQTASIDTNEPKRDAHLRSPDFFDAAKNPTITFQSTKIEKTDQKDVYNVTGDLTMRGVTRPVVLRVEMTGAGPDAFGGYRMGFDATTTINRKDFGVSWNKVLDNGSAMLGDDVQIDFAVEAVKKAS